MTKNLKLLAIYAIPYIVVSLFLIPDSAYMEAMWSLSDRVFMGVGSNIGPIGFILLYIDPETPEWWVVATISLVVWLVIVAVVFKTKIKSSKLKLHYWFVGLWHILSLVFSAIVASYAA